MTTATLSPSRERALLLTLAGIQFSHILDFMIMMPLGPILMRYFNIGTHEFGFLVASYSFSAAVSGLLSATFVDRFERKRFLLVMFALFGLSSLACGFAPGYISLLVARGAAGAFGGVMGAMVQTIVGDVIPFERRARASSVVMSAFSVSTIAGVPLSLALANQLGWRAPFVLVAVLTLLFGLAGLRLLPELRQHLHQPRHPLSSLFETLRDPNHLRALLFSGLIIFSGFTVIPYITVYAVANLGIPQGQVPLIYLCGGAATLISARWIGHRADLHGKTRVYRQVAALAFIPLLLVTQTEHATLALWLLCTTSFFVLISGRMIPAMAIITSAAQPKLRGTFMSLNACMQQLASGLASMLAGMLTHQAANGSIVGYPHVGYVAMVANLLAIWFVGRIVLHTAPERHP